MYFILFNAFFGFVAYTLKVNVEEVKEFETVGKPFGYWIIAFSNSVGNIVSPTYTNLGDSAIDVSIIFAITIFWLFNQIAVLIVFLNFVIAVLSDVYETVMDHKVRFIYGHRQ